MKLRVVQRANNLYFYCSNGSILVPSESDLRRLLTGFKRPNSFKGSDGAWSDSYASMDDAPGMTIAYVDDKGRLILSNEQIFLPILKSEIKYVSASEYADMHGKCRASVKNMCMDGRIEGAYKTSSGWLIPEDAPYPERKKRTTKPKMDETK